MALNSMLRRAASSVLPAAIRGIGSRRAFHIANSAALCVERNGLAPKMGQRGVLPISRFSKAISKKHLADEILLRVLDEEIEAAEEEPKDVVAIPDGYPFQIHDTPGERTILLKRRYRDEDIQVELDAADVEYDDEDDDDDDDDNENNDVRSSIPMVVRVSKGNGKYLEFSITAFPDKIVIDGLAVNDPDGSGDQLLYEGPDFSELDENLQEALHGYLEARGIRSSTTNLLFQYMIKKDNEEYFRWLHNLKEFVKK